MTKYLDKKFNVNLGGKAYSEGWERTFRNKEPSEVKDQWQILRDERDRLRSALEDIAEGDCSYGDNCPTFGSHHGQCVVCKAKEALQGEENE